MTFTSFYNQIREFAPGLADFACKQDDRVISDYAIVSFGIEHAMYHAPTATWYYRRRSNGVSAPTLLEAVLIDDKAG